MVGRMVSLPMVGMVVVARGQVLLVPCLRLVVVVGLRTRRPVVRMDLLVACLLLVPLRGVPSLALAAPMMPSVLVALESQLLLESLLRVPVECHAVAY